MAVEDNKDNFQIITAITSEKGGQSMRLEFTVSLSETTSETANVKPRGDIAIDIPRLVTGLAKYSRLRVDNKVISHIFTFELGFL